jgi:predicted DNA-binding transcriptional regulator AlpA
MSVQQTKYARKKEIRNKKLRERGPLDPNDPLALIRKDELAALLRVNPWTIDAWRKKKRIPEPIVISPQIVAWRRSDIDRWLIERQLDPAPTRVVKRRGD